MWQLKTIVSCIGVLLADNSKDTKSDMSDIDFCAIPISFKRTVQDLKEILLPFTVHRQCVNEIVTENDYKYTIVFS